GQIAGWDLAPALAILMREIFVAGLREFLGEKQVTLHVSTLAKYKTAAQLVAIGAVLLAGLVPEIGLVADLLLWLAAALTVWTGYHYLSGAWGALTVTVK
ncbi:MAG: CDP-alcohol phosphatidyltransferase family protein, partial [Cucumibacter sp.]